MSDIDPELKALAFVVYMIRPSWHRTSIEQALDDDHRDLAALTRAAVQAATNPQTIHPNGIRTTFPGADGCTVCAERKLQAERNSQPPQIQLCERCERVLEPGIEHACRSQRPEGWNDYQVFWRANLAKQRILREAIVNDPGNYELAVRNRTEIAELKAEVEARAAQLDEEMARS